MILFFPVQQPVLHGTIVSLLYSMWMYVDAILLLGTWLVISFYLLISSSRIKRLKDIDPGGCASLPSVAIIVPVRNEEKNLQQALSTLCRLNYPGYKIIMVNDRSTDGTAEIIQSYCAQFKHVEVVNIDHLPVGWLGKSYALYQGYLQSDAEWLLFTDADVELKEDALLKAISFCRQTKADHLTVLPEVRSGSAWVNCLHSFFQVLFHLRYRPWSASNPQSTASLGMGAFNLVSREAYKTMGTHAHIALHPNDDLKLGEAVKAAGAHQQVLYGKDAVKYEWYETVHAFIEGLTKNAFSSMNYDIGKVAFNIVGTMLFFVLPIPIFLLSADPLLVLVSVAVLSIQSLLFIRFRGAKGRWWYALLIPFSACVMAYILARSAFRTLRHQGIYWSDRFYKLSELKRCD
ncbi:glycosyltransferase [Aridibaculum aurantiacum]|uniref:glycosyltransferase n=1 Tax=Aridibaculum aurantiacum TaxID=2810307 RepID=UPI001A977BA3|nr:glycosyltransferase family 2 protein [Aridibaculum aurantiacum]